MPYYNTVPVRGVTTQRTVTFRGVRRHDRIREGEWSAAENLTSDHAPMLAVRRPRGLVETYPGEILALSPADPPAVLCRAENDPDAVQLCWQAHSETFPCPADKAPGGIVRMGAVLILPGLDAWVNTETCARGSLSARFGPPAQDITADGMQNPYVLKLCPCDETGAELRVFTLTNDAEAEHYEADPAQNPVPDGECYGIGSKRLLRQYHAANSEKWTTAPHLLRIEADGIAAGFRPGDFVRISGLPTEWVEGVFVDDYAVDAIDPFWSHNRFGDFDDDPNGLREIALVGEGFLVLKDVFYTRRVTVSETVAAAVSVGRTVPEMDFVVEAQNRLWGCRCGTVDGKPVNELYASALGDWQSWERYSGLSTASWTASVGSEGPFTGAAVLDGCPVFFKAGCVHRVWPAAGGAHRVTELRVPGVAPGCAGSIVPFEGGLAYVSHAGVVRWSGGSVTVLSEALGALRPVRAAAGAWGRKLWLALTEDGDAQTLWVYDAEHETWFSESGLPGLPECFAAVGAQLYAASGSALWDLMGGSGEPEAQVRWHCTSGLVGYAVTEQKYLSRFVLRLILPRGSSMDVWLEYDSDGVWRHAGHLRGQGTGSFLLPVRPRRCDHFRVRLTGAGDARIYSIVKHLVRGSDLP